MNELIDAVGALTNDVAALIHRCDAKTKSNRHQYGSDDECRDKRHDDMKEVFSNLQCLSQSNDRIFYTLHYRMYGKPYRDHTAYPDKCRKYMQKDDLMGIGAKELHHGLLHQLPPSSTSAR